MNTKGEERKNNSTMMIGGTKEIFISSENELAGDIVGKLSVLMTESDDESDFSSEGFVREQKLEEIMQELYREITTSPPAAVTWTSPSSSSSPPFTLPHPPFFSVTDVNSQSCGVSLSDSASSVMAGIEFISPLVGKLGFPVTGNVSPEEGPCVRGTEFIVTGEGSAVVEGYGEDQKMNGCDEGDVGDDQWLTRVLKWGPLELEEWT